VIKQKNQFSLFPFFGNNKCIGKNVAEWALDNDIAVAVEEWLVAFSILFFLYWFQSPSKPLKQYGSETPAVLTLNLM
jgi:hypothetical protein